MKIKWYWQAREFYLALPLAFNYYKSPDGHFQQFTLAVLFCWVRIEFLKEKT